MNELLELISKGIPISVPLNIFYNDIKELSNDKKWLGGKVGITSILHTWGQTLEFHPHIHSIVTGGGLVIINGFNVKMNIFLKFKFFLLFLEENF